MGVNILILLLIWSNLFSKCMAVCAITPDSNGHVTIPMIGLDWSMGQSSKAFRDCYALQSVTIGGGVTGISHDAFRDCSALQSVTIGDSITSIGENAFQIAVHCSP